MKNWGLLTKGVTNLGRTSGVGRRVGPALGGAGFEIPESGSVRQVGVEGRASAFERVSGRRIAVRGESLPRIPAGRRVLVGASRGGSLGALVRDESREGFSPILVGACRWAWKLCLETEPSRLAAHWKRNDAARGDSPERRVLSGGNLTADARGASCGQGSPRSDAQGLSRGLDRRPSHWRTDRPLTRIVF